MDQSALQLGSRFSISPNYLGYCGRRSATSELKKCIKWGKCEMVEREITKFIVLYPYLRAISDIAKQPVFSYPVIESYWLGNDQLKKAKLTDYSLLLDYFLKQGVPDFFVDDLRLKIPKVFIPNHLFHVLHVGVGKASGAVPFTIDSINNCMIRWGKVENIAGGRATLLLHSLKKNGETMYKETLIREILPIDKTFVSKLKVKDTVAVHWEQIIKVLTGKEEGNLAYWTGEVCKSQF